ncbi:unnamed protein product, partial [Staurois parvus]
FDSVLSDPPLLLFPFHLLIEQSLGGKLHVLSLVFFFSWESACDQHRANQHCSGRGQGSCILLEQNENSSYKL